MVRRAFPARNGTQGGSKAMTTTRWMAACALALALAAPAAAQQCPAQAPCYPALPQVLIPVQAPVAVTEVCAEPPCPTEVGPREKARLDSIRRRTVEALLQLHVFFHRAGCYHAAEFVAAEARRQSTGTGLYPQCALAVAQSRACVAAPVCGGDEA